MKWMIASDLHGSYFYASQMQQAFEREQADRLLLLGDLLYHGPRNDTCVWIMMSLEMRDAGSLFP